VAPLRDVLEDAVRRLRASGSETPRLDAEVLLGWVLGVDRTGVIAHPDAPVSDPQRDRFAAALGRREAGEPVAYIRGFKEFHGLAMSADPRVLIPRPETELLVDLALARIAAALTAAPRPDGSPPYCVLDVGTGSGAIPIAVATGLRRRRYADAVRIEATDISVDALALAVENAVGHGVADMIDFRHADLLADDVIATGPWDLVMANLPYIPSADVPRLAVAASFEPRVALDGGDDGLDLVRRLIERLPAALTRPSRAPR